MCPFGGLCTLSTSCGIDICMPDRSDSLRASWRVNVEVLWAQLHSVWSEELTSLSPCSSSGLELSSVASRSWDAEPCWEDSVQENSRVCLSPGLEQSKRSPSKAFPKSTLLLLSSLDICKHRTARVSVYLLASNDRDSRIKLKSGLLRSSKSIP